MKEDIFNPYLAGYLAASMGFKRQTPDRECYTEKEIAEYLRGYDEYKKLPKL